MKFEAMHLPFDWTNEDWALSHLPQVRVANIMFAKDNAQLQDAMARCPL